MDRMNRCIYGTIAVGNWLAWCVSLMELQAAAAVAARFYTLIAKALNCAEYRQRLLCILGKMEICSSLGPREILVHQAIYRQ